MKITELERLVGGLSNPSKMPGFSYGTPARECMIGSILRSVKGSVCSKCYAYKGMYSFPVVQAAQYRRLETMENLSEWTANMTELLSRKYAKKAASEKYFRWHDSGDLRSVEHLSAIVQIANNLPGINFWLPTKEYAIVRAYPYYFPANLTVRVSAPMIGKKMVSILGTVSSTVGAGKGFRCPAPSQNGKCGDCRACWKPKVSNVDYHQH